MLRSIATVSISGTLPEKLHAIAAAGYQGVEIFENDLLYYTGTPAEIRQLAADLGLKITLFQPFRDFEGASRRAVCGEYSPRSAQVCPDARAGLRHAAAVQQCAAGLLGG